jgi:hypothetical protein
MYTVYKLYTWVLTVLSALIYAVPAGLQHVELGPAHGVGATAL